MVAGRSSEPRTATVTTTNTSTAITGAAGTFNEEDAGRSIAATGIPAGATLASVTSDTAATLSAAATAAGSVSATIGAGTQSGLTYGFLGWSPESDAESETYSIAGGAGATAPDRLTNSYTPVSQRSRG